MKFRLLARLISLPAASCAVHAADLAIPANGVDLTGTKHLQQTRKIMLPGVYVEVMNWGKITSVTSTSALQTLGGAANGAAKAEMEVAVPADLDMLQSVAAELYQDLATKLRAAGWEVVTYAEVRNDPVMKKVSLVDSDPKLGVPVRKVKTSKQELHYTVAAPLGMPVIDPGMTMPMWNIRALLKEINATGLETVYRFDPVALKATGRHGMGGTNYAETEAHANLMLAHAQAQFATAKMFPGSIRLKKPLVVESEIGVVKKTKDVSPEFENRLSKALTYIGGGQISKSKGLYVCELDPVRLKPALLAAGKAFNDEIVKGAGKAP